MMSMMPQMKPNLPPGHPRLIALYRFQFWVYAVRHALGLALFSFLIALSFQSQAAPMGWVFLVLTLGYGGMVAVNTRKLYIAWKKNEAGHRQQQTNAAPARREDR